MRWRRRSVGEGGVGLGGAWGALGDGPPVARAPSLASSTAVWPSPLTACCTPTPPSWSTRPSPLRTQAFLKLDKDRSGFITADELRAALGAANVSLDASDLKAICDKFDTNRDGRVDVTELAKLLTVQPYEGHLDRGTSPRPVKRTKS